MSRRFAWLALGFLAPLIPLACQDDGGGDAMSTCSGAVLSGATGCDSSSVPVWTGDGSTGSSSGGSSSASSSSTGWPTDSTWSHATGDTSSASDSGTTSQPCTLFPATEVPGCPTVLGTQYCAENGLHIPADQPATWTTNPPHSGVHEATWTSWGVHEDFVSPRTWVHNLEHSGVVLLHACPGGCPEQVAVLAEVVAQRPKLRVMVTGYPELQGSRFAAVSWGWIYRTDAPDLATLLCFVDQHEGHAPENIPKGVSSSMGSCNLE